jgi:hypothetical protein
MKNTEAGKFRPAWHKRDEARYRRTDDQLPVGQRSRIAPSSRQRRPLLRRSSHSRRIVRAIFRAPPDDWGGKAALAWVSRLREGSKYDLEIERAEKVAEIIDAIYGCNK